MSQFFKPKSKPILSWSRLVHLLLAATTTAYGVHLGGYNGCGWASGGVVIGGFLWEVGNKWLKGNHRYGDILDFWAFIVGSGIVAVPYAIFAVN